MDTIEFFDAVLPTAGRRCIALKRDGRDGMIHTWGDDNTWAAECALRADEKPGVQVFHGCAGYGPENSRKGENVVAVRAFWLDVDAGPDKPYADAVEALQALKVFCRGLGLPTPLVVLSGVGVHAYWPLTADITPDQWRATARLLKAAVTGSGLKVDPTRTADIASILRPVGTHHKKGEPVLIYARPAPAVDYETFHNILTAVTGIEPEDELGTLPAYLASTFSPDDNLRGEREFAPSFADRVAAGCAVVGAVRDGAGIRLPQPHWYAVLGVLARCEDGEVKAHEWSALDDRYREIETQSSLERAGKFGPTTCEKIAEITPEMCGVCPHWGKIKSPIVLGSEPVELPEPVKATIRGMGFGDADPEEQVAHLFPYGFGFGTYNGWPQSKMFALIKDEDGNDERVGICETLFYPVERLQQDDVAGMEIEMVVRNSETRRFTLPTSLIGEGGAKLHSLLASKEIVALPGQKLRIDNLFAAWVTQLKTEREAIVSYSRFGWQGPDFLIGDKLVTPSGIKRAVVRGTASKKALAFEPAGSLQEWVRVIDAAYNYDGQEAYQFMVLCAFAAPLLNMFGEFGGVTVYAHSEGTGVGKTTAQRAGLSAFGDYRRLQIADGQATYNALMKLIGAYHNIPVVFDELTNQGGSEASRLVYNISSGQDKYRLDTTGELRDDSNSDWSTIVMASGNNKLSEKLSLHRGNAEAEISRLFEFTVRNTSTLSPNDAADLFPRLVDNYGHAGLMYLEHIIGNQDAVKTALWATRKQVNETLGLTQGERYWGALFACVRTAHAYAKHLGLVGFRGQPLMQWMGDQLDKNRGGRNEAAVDGLDLYGRMVNELLPGVLVTRGEGDLRAKREAFVLAHPHGAIVGRAIVPPDDAKNTKPLLILSVDAVRVWCGKNAVSYSEMFNAVVADGIAEPTPKRYSLGKGVHQYAQVAAKDVWCWFIDPRRAGSAIDSVPVSAIASIVRTDNDQQTGVRHR